MRGVIEDCSCVDDDHPVSESGHDDAMNVTKKTKKKKPGIVYLSSIPKYMTAAYLREVLSSFGEVGRVYLQEDNKEASKTRRKKSQKFQARNYAEGWVEFKSKRVAKEVTKVLNNTQMGGRKKSKFYDYIWTIKYLPRFKWTHLSERLSYEQAIRKQRMRAEINQAKREADFFSHNMDKSKKLKTRLSKGKKLLNNDAVKIHQRETENQIVEKKNVKNASLTKDHKYDESLNERDSFLKSLFS